MSPQESCYRYLVPWLFGLLLAQVISLDCLALVAKWSLGFWANTLAKAKRWLFYLMYRNHHRESNKMKKQRNMFQMKEQDKNSGKKL